MTARALRLLLRLSPADFRERCGDEFVSAYEWRAGRRRNGAGRLLLSLREVLGLCTVVLRLRGGALRRALVARLTGAASVLRPDPARWGGPAVGLGAVCIVVGNGIGYGAGRQSGFVLATAALGALAWGLAGRARTAEGLSRTTRRIAAVSAASGALLALLVVLTEAPVAPVSTFASVLRYPASLAFMAGIVALGARGAMRRELPVLPALAIAAGAAVVPSGMLGYEGVALAGAYLSVAGWVGLAIVPWGRRGGLPVG